MKIHELHFGLALGLVCATVAIAVFWTATRAIFGPSSHVIVIGSTIALTLVSMKVLSRTVIASESFKKWLRDRDWIRPANTENA